MDFVKKMLQIQRLEEQVKKREAYLAAKEAALDAKARGMRQNVVPVNGPQDLQRNLNANLDPQMVPGNVGDINKVIWPFFFTTNLVVLAPNTSVKSGFTVTHEAAFIMMSYTKTVFTRTAGPEVNTYIDPEQPGAAGNAYGMSFTIRDSQSGRDFENFPIDLNGVGQPRFPTKFPRPMMFLPNSNVEISFNNSDLATTYVPMITVFGYRARIEDAQNILSTVFA